MIHARNRLYDGCPPGTEEHYKLRLLDHFLLAPLGDKFDLTVSDGFRTLDEQANLTFADGRPVPGPRRAKGISQHNLGEAGDVTGDFDELRAAFLFAVEFLRPWQIILYMDEPRSLHLSIPSKVEAIVPKQLIFVDGTMRWWRGEWPIII